MTLIFDMQVTRYSDVVIQAQRTHNGIMHQFELHPVCAVNVSLNKEQILDHFYKQCLRVIIF